MKQYSLIITVICLLCCASYLWCAPPVQHPNLLLNREEIVQVKDKIRKYPWAAELWKQTQKTAAGDASGDFSLRELAFCYAFGDERAAADKARARLLDMARHDLPLYESPGSTYGIGAFQTPWDGYAWVYDLICDTCSNEERQLIERWLRAACKALIAARHRSTDPDNVHVPNGHILVHFNIGIVGYCLGDTELIDFALNDPGNVGPISGGFYPVMDSMVKDGMFWNEAPLYLMEVDLWGMLALAEAALHYDGTDLYHYTAENGASLKGLIDGYLRMGYPLERTGIGAGALRIASYGDGTTSYSALGVQRDLYLTNDFFETALEIGYKRYRDPAYAWVLSLNPDRDTDLGMRAGRQMIRASIWGFPALTHGEPLPANPPPPPAPSGVYPGQGFAMLRADESPTYWTGGSLAAMMRLGATVGHGHADYFSLMLHGKGRLLYPCVQFWQYEGTFLGWGREGVAHSTLLADYQSPKPGPVTTRQDFNPEVKYCATSGVAFASITQTRRLLLTKEYLVDIFHAADPSGEAHTFDWVLHGLGRLYPGNPGAYQPTNALLPYYWWVENERGRAVDHTWHMDWIQRSAGVTPGLQNGKEWFDHEVGVRMTMLGSPGTQAYYGDGPITDGPPYGRIDGNPEGAVPMTVVRRHSPATTYAAVHEPYEGAPRIRQISRLAESPDAIALEITTPDYTDYVMTAFDTQLHTLRTPAGELFSFTDYAYLRFAQGGIIARGKLTALRITTKLPMFTLNGRQQSLQQHGAFMQMGDFSGAIPFTRSTEKDDPSEQNAALQYYFLPEEVHLSAANPDDAREVEMHLRAVGPGETHGTLRIQGDVRVIPETIEIAPLHEGEERTVRLKVWASDKVAKGLYSIKFIPSAGMFAAKETLTASVGVVTTEDRRIPDKMQYVVRAPGYTLKVDVRSGGAYYLLDADGHRRFGAMHGTNFCYGFPGIDQVRFGGNPSVFVWPVERPVSPFGDRRNALPTFSHPGDTSIDAVFDWGNATQIRYIFYEDRIVMMLVAGSDSDPNKSYTMWLGNFDALNPPVHHGTQEQPWKPIVADWFYFPHPVYRQGVLITPPSQTPLSYMGSAVNFPIKVGQQVTLKFATRDEIERLN